MGCVCTSIEAQNEILQAKNVEIEREIVTIEKRTIELKNKAGPGIDLETLKKTNADLKQQVARGNAIRKQNDELQKQQAQLRRENAELLKVGMDIQRKPTLTPTLELNQELWAPLTELVNKFNEFDFNASGFIDRNEFHKLCRIIETELQIVRLHSGQNQHSASSVYGNNKSGQGHNTGCIDSKQGWSAQHNNQQQWYQIDAVVIIYVAGLIIQGRENHDQWVKTFKISHSKDGQTWNNLDQLFNANSDRSTKNRILFESPIEARYIRIHPISWKNHISMRCDLLWIENYKELELEKAREQRKSQFTFDEQDQLFDLFDIKQTGGIDVGEFLSVLDSAVIRSPQNHPYRIIKQSMQHLLYGHVNIKEEDHIDMLGKKSIGYKYPEKIDVICCVCYYEPGIYGYNDKCKHCVCQECLKDSLKYIMENGKFPAYCVGCKAEESMVKDQNMDLDILIRSELLRFWVETEIIDLKFALRFNNQQNRFIQNLSDQQLSKSSTLRKCPECNFVFFKNENDSKCQKCAAEL